jgi:hypothetical protein
LAALRQPAYVEFGRSGSRSSQVNCGGEPPQDLSAPQALTGDTRPASMSPSVCSPSISRTSSGEPAEQSSDLVPEKKRPSEPLVVRNANVREVQDLVEHGSKISSRASIRPDGSRPLRHASSIIAAISSRSSRLSSTVAAPRSKSTWAGRRSPTIAPSTAG